MADLDTKSTRRASTTHQASTLVEDTQLIASRPVRVALAVTRLAIGWVFLWAFLDKLLGLGFDTPREAAWFNGGSPTEGFLLHATSGPFASTYQSFAGAGWADWLFMVGLLGIGVALMLGIGVRIAAVSGALMLFLMWSAILPLENNPFMNDHLIYALILVVIALANNGDTWGLGRRWSRLVRNYPVLR